MFKFNLDNWFAKGESKCDQNLLTFQAKCFDITKYICIIKDSIIHFKSLNFLCVGASLINRSYAFQ